MKNKKLTYILFPIVIIIWGLVIYRIFFEGQTKPENIAPVVKPVIKTDVKEEQRVYRLIANYRDPFLNEIKTSVIEIKQEENKEEVNQRSSNLRRRRTSVSRIRWPEIKYGGFIEDDQNRKFTILLNIKNRDYLAHEGDTVDQIFIKEFYKDSIIVVYNNEEKTLTK